MARRWKDHFTISSQIGEWLTTCLISLNIWRWDRWEWLNEKKGVEAKDCDEFELMKMIVPLLIFIVEISDTDRRNRVYWSHSLIFRRHSHYCTSIQTSLQFIIHINSSISYQPVRNVQIVFCSVSINHNLLLHTEQLESMWIQP